MIKRPVFKYIEHELYNYDEIKQSLVEIREDVLEGSPPPPDGTPNLKGQVVKPTEIKILKLSTPAILHMERTIRAIDRALNRLDDTHRHLFELKYRQELNWQKVCMTMPISERTYFRARGELVGQVAEELGLK